MSDRPQDPWAPDGPPVLDDPLAVDVTEVRTSGIGARVVAIGVGAAMLVGGVAFAATQLGGGSGAGTPEAAVAELFEAMGDEDVLGVLASLEPGERDTLKEPVQQLFEELERIEVVDESFDLASIPGIDLEFEGLTFRTEPIVDGLARVHLTGGSASYAVDGAELPVGDFLADTFERFGVDHTSFSSEETEQPLEGEDTFLVARESDDGWRVSLGYTAAEAARLAMGKPVPATGMAPIGSDSPEEAVEGFLQAATTLDVRGMVGRLSPGELRALHHYWPVLVDESTLPTADDLDATVTITDLELDSSIDGDRAQVFIRAIGADVTSEDFDGGATVADGCVTLRGDALESVQEELSIDDDTICLDEIGEVLEEAAADFEGTSIDIAQIEDMIAQAQGDVPELGITATRIDGQWYIAPVRTFADVGIAMLRTVDREDLDAAVDAIEDFFGEGFFSGGSIGGGFVAPGMDDFEDLEGFEDLDELGELGGEVTEDFGEIGDPIEPGTTDPRTSALVEELFGMVAGDPQVAACAIAELQATATPDQLVELADSYEYDFEPSMEAHELFFGALERCGA